MKKIVLLVILFQIVSASALYAQHAVSSATWQILNLYSIKSVGNKYVINFPPEVKALENKIIELPGYMVPIKAGKTHQEFLLSVLPVQQCAFCGQGDYPPMVLIVVQKPVYYTDKAVIVKGKLVLNQLGTTAPEYSLINANINQ